MPDRPTHNDAVTTWKADLSRAEARVRHILASKGASALDYWTARGRGRFAREFEQDGIGAYEATALLDRIERELISAELEAALKKMAAREAKRVPPSA